MSAPREVDYRLMRRGIDDGRNALHSWGETDGEATSQEYLLLSIAHSLQAIAVALAATHLEDTSSC